MSHSGPFFWEAQRNRRLDEDGSRQSPTSRTVDDRTLDAPRAKHPLDGGIRLRESEAGQEHGSPMSVHDRVDRGQRLQGVQGHRGVQGSHPFQMPSNDFSIEDDRFNPKVKVLLRGIRRAGVGRIGSSRDETDQVAPFPSDRREEGTGQPAGKREGHAVVPGYEFFDAILESPEESAHLAGCPHRITRGTSLRRRGAARGCWAVQAPGRGTVFGNPARAPSRLSPRGFRDRR